MRLIQRVVALGVVWLALGTGDAAAQTLTPSGVCPGPMTFTTTGGAAFTRFAYAVSPSTGSWAIPGGQICGTTVLGLASPVTLLGFVSANGAGTGVFTANVPAAACGTRFMQVVDTLTCTTSNVILVI